MNNISPDSQQEPGLQAHLTPLRTALCTLLSHSLEGLHFLLEEGMSVHRDLVAALGEALQTVAWGLACTEETGDNRHVDTAIARLRSVLQQTVKQCPAYRGTALLRQETAFLPLAACAHDTPFLSFPDDIDIELANDFIIETQEHVASAEEALLALETDPEDRAALDAVFRAFHTVKGTATFLGLPPIAQLAHAMECLLSRMRDGDIRCVGGYADLALRATDTLKELVYILQEASKGTPSRLPQTFSAFLATLAYPEAAGISEETLPMPPPRLGDLLVAGGLVERRELENIVATNQGKPLGVALLRSGIVSLPEVAHALRTQQRLSGKECTRSTSVQVRTTHLDHLRELTGECMTAYAAMLQDVASYPAFHQQLEHLGTTLHSLQALSKEMRLVPCGTLFQKMTRIIRNIARQTHKLVTFETAGEDITLDRHTADMLTAPLMHLVCNAVSHGIEPPEKRLRCGKTRAGTVHLKASCIEKYVVIELQDDGKGLDRPAIRTRALKKGLIPPEKDLSERDIDRLIFQPGFSTAAEVNAVSGRGVGMDVVQRNIELLHGRIEVASTQGQGTTFTLYLPLTQL